MFELVCSDVIDVGFNCLFERFPHPEVSIEDLCFSIRLLGKGDQDVECLLLGDLSKVLPEVLLKVKRVGLVVGQRDSFHELTDPFIIVGAHDFLTVNFLEYLFETRSGFECLL